MRVFITGGAGFIGSHVASELLAQGNDVAVYDSFQCYFPRSVTYQENMQYRLKHLLRDAALIWGSTLDLTFLTYAVSDFEPDCVIHLAALPLASMARAQPERAFRDILKSAFNVLEALRGLPKAPWLVYVSSSMVYGDFLEEPQPESALLKPIDIYGSMKLAGELWVKAYGQQYGLPWTIVRPSAVYGPSDNNRRVLQIFVENAVAGKPISVTDPKSTFLDFTYVEDAARGIALAATQDEGASNVFNITRGVGRSLEEVVELLKSHFPDLKVRELSASPEHRFRPRRGALDITRARDLLGYNPQFSLEAGLAKYIAYVRNFNRSLLT